MIHLNVCRRQSIELIRIALSVACLTATVLSCSTRSVHPPLTASQVNADSVWRRISSEEDYTDYPSWPGHEGIRRGQEPHGVFHRAYVNDTLRNALPLPDRIAPPGSIIVKENLNAERTIEAITVMVKITGYDSEANDWYWAKYTPSGQTEAAGKVQGCITCHAVVHDNDYVMIRPLDAPVDMTEETRRGKMYREE